MASRVAAVVRYALGAFDLCDVGRSPPQVGVLQHVLGIDHAAEHAIRKPEQQLAVLFKDFVGCGL